MNPKNPEFRDETPVMVHHYLGDYREDVVSAEDWLSHRFNVGDRVMYCIGAGRGQMMAIGEVKQIRARKRRNLVSWAWEGGIGTAHGRRINEVWEDYWDVEVQVLTEKTSGNWGNEKRTKPAWVNPMNITAMEGL